MIDGMTPVLQNINAYGDASQRANKVNIPVQPLNIG